jgi:SAM-dependent methyltransferase
MATLTKWPKTQVPLTAEEETAWEGFFTLWHEVLPKRYRMIERFNHSFPIRHARPDVRETLEIGAGLGGHLEHERLSPSEERSYFAVELRASMAEQIRIRYPRVNVVVADCQAPLPFAEDRFDRCVAVHVLEHLPNLPGCLREVWRLLDKQRGQLLAVIPCEGGPAYSLARRLSAQPLFEGNYRMRYKPLIEREHLNRPHEILAELEPYFVVERRRFYPFPFLPSIAANLCIGLALRPRPVPLNA